MLRVNGCRRVPEPPARMIPLIIGPDCTLDVMDRPGIGPRSRTYNFVTCIRAHAYNMSTPDPITEFETPSPTPKRTGSTRRLSRWPPPTPTAGLRPHGPAARRRRARVRVPHQLQQPQGAGARRQPVRRALLSLADARGADPRSRARSSGCRQTSPTPTSPAARAAASSAPGRRRRARCSRHASSSRGVRRDRSTVRRTDRFRGRRSGAASASSRRTSSSGTADAGCTIESLYVRKGAAWTVERLFP